MMTQDDGASPGEDPGSAQSAVSDAAWAIARFIETYIDMSPGRDAVEGVIAGRLERMAGEVRGGLLWSRLSAEGVPLPGTTAWHGPPAPDADAIALGTLEALQSEVNAAIDRMKAKYLVSALLVPLQMPPGGADLYENPGFEEVVRLAVSLARLMRQHGLENVVVNGLGFASPPPTAPRPYDPGAETDRGPPPHDGGRAAV